MIRLLIFILIIPGFLIGQTQPIEKIEMEPDPIIQDAFDAISGRMNDVNRMFKLTTDRGLRFGYEMKLGKALSLNPQLNLGTGIGIGPGVNINIEAQSTVGLRYFFRHKERIEAGLQGNNLNGLYAELGTEFSIFGGVFSGFNDFIYLKVGSQSRVFKYGLVDIGLRVSYAPDNGSLNISTGFDMGFAHSKNYQLDEFENNKCAIVNCYEENRKLVKIPANNLINIDIGRTVRSVGFNPTINFEHKISKVSLSMTHEFTTNLNALEILTGPSQTSSFFGAHYEMGIKWIMGKRRQVIKGETANNLSGSYFGPIGRIGYEQGKVLAGGNYSGSFFAGGLRLGYQTRLLKNLYADLYFGAAYKEYFELHDPNNTLNLIISSNSTIIPVGNFSVGYAF